MAFIIKWNLFIGIVAFMACTKNNGEKTRSLLEKGSLDISDN